MDTSVLSNDPFFVTDAVISLFIVTIAPFLAVYLFTICRFHITSRASSRFKGKEPPTVPYWIPYIGNAFSMISDPHRFFEQTLQRRPDRGPVKMRLGPITMYLIMGADNIQTIFRHSKQLSFEFMQLRIAEKVKGLPKDDAHRLSLDDSGTGTTPLCETAKEDRIWHNLHSIYLKNLTEKKAVNFLTSKFVFEFSEQLQTVRWQTATMGLYAFLQKYQFQASTITLVGPRIIKHGPEFANSFWDYDAAFMGLMQGLPKFMRRGGWRARDRCLAATKEWLAAATMNSTNDDDASIQDQDWDENFGHRLVRERNAALFKYGISFEGRAAMHMGLIWAINANAIPMTAYILMKAVCDPDLFHRIRCEVRTAMIQGTKSKSALDIDMDKLTSLPLLKSVYNECLRLHSSIPISRRLRDDVEIDGYKLKAGNFILAPSWLSHVDENVWARPEHPAREFWAERFMQADKKKVKLGDYCPYGGGNVICPGRFFAEREILAAVAMMVTLYDMEFVRYSRLDGGLSDRGPGMEKAECRGIVSLDRDVVVNFRRRAFA